MQLALFEHLRTVFRWMADDPSHRLQTTRRYLPLHLSEHSLKFPDPDDLADCCSMLPKDVLDFHAHYYD